MNIKVLDFTNESEIKKVEEFINSKRNVDVKQTIQWYELRNEKKYFFLLPVIQFASFFTKSCDKEQSRI